MSINYALPVIPPQPTDDGSFVHFNDEELFAAPQTPSRLNVITNSLRNTFLDCSMKYYWEYIRRMTAKVTPEYFVWGSFLHLAIEHVAAGETIEEVQDRLRALVEREAQQRQLSSYLVNQYEGFILLIPHVLEAYLLHYKHDYDRYEIIVSETKFSLPLGNTETASEEGKGWLFEGKIDKIVRDTRTASKYVWDVKTPAATGDSFFTRLPLDSQMKGYVMAGQKAIGIDVNHALYDVIQKPSVQQKMKCNDPAEWAEVVGTQYLVQHEKLFKRSIVEYKQWQIEHYYVELCMLAKQIAFHQREGLWIQHHPGNRIGGCPFFNICVNGEQPVLMQDFYERKLQDFNKEL